MHFAQKHLKGLINEEIDRANYYMNFHPLLVSSLINPLGVSRFSTFLKDPAPGGQWSLPVLL